MQIMVIPGLQWHGHFIQMTMAIWKLKIIRGTVKFIYEPFMNNTASSITNFYRV